MKHHKITLIQQIRNSLLALYIGLILCLTAPSAFAAPTAVDGEFNVPQWQFADDELLLVGEWQVIWGQLVEPAEFDQKYTGETFDLPQNWDDASPLLDGAYGVATFRLKLDLPSYDRELAFLIVSPNSAWNFYLDGELLGGNGVVTDDPEKFVRHYIQRVFTAKHGKSEVMFQIANFSNGHGGLQYATAVLDAEKLRQRHDTMSLFFVLALGILFSVGLIHLVFYLADRKHREQGPVHLWFSLLCFLLVLRVFGVIPFFHIYVPEFIYWSTLFLPYFTLYASPAVYLLFFQTAFPAEFPARTTKVIIWVLLFFTALVCVIPEYYYTLTKNFAILVNIFAIVYSIIFTVIAIMRRRAGAIAILISNILFFLTALNDAVLHMTAGYGFDLTPFGIVILGLGYSYALLLRLQNTFDEARDTSKELEILNVELEEKVADRTKAFEAAAAKAENSAHEKAQFIAAASHDLRQPLHALSMFNFALKRQVQEEKLSGLVEKQSNAINNLSTLLQDTLDVSKTDSLKRKPKFAALNVTQLIDSILNSFGIRAQDKGVKISKNIAVGTLGTDAAMLQRILSNLIDNALKAARTSIEVNARQEGNDWVFDVIDDGSGMELADVNRIFESYISLGDEQPTETGGYGLGLYVVNEFTKSLHGNIKVQDTSEKGSHFVLTLPNEADKTVAKSDLSVRIVQALSLGGIKILAVDDEVEILNAMKAMLSSWDCELLTASNVNQAQEHLSSGFRPDMLLVDYHLHGSNGLKLIAQLRAEFDTEFPAIIITGATQSAILDKITEAGFEYLSKPLDVELLGMALQAVKPSRP